MIDKVIEGIEKKMACDQNDISDLQNQINTLNKQLSQIQPIYYYYAVGYNKGGTGWYSVFTINTIFSDTYPYYYELYYGNTFNYTETSLTKIGILKGYKNIVLSKLFSGPGELKGPFSKIRVIRLSTNSNYLCIQLYANKSIYDTNPQAGDSVAVRVFNYGWIGASINPNYLTYYNKTDDLLNDDELIKEITL